MAYLARSATDEDVAVANHWEDERIPEDAKEWKKAFEVIARYVCPRWEDLAEWWVVHYTTLEKNAAEARRRQQGKWLRTSTSSCGSGCRW